MGAPARDQQPDAVPCGEAMRRRSEAHLHAADAVGRTRPAGVVDPLDAITHVPAAALLVDIAEPDERLSGLDQGGLMDPGGDRADDLDRLAQRPPGECDHVITGDQPVLTPPHLAGEDGPPTFGVGSAGS